MYRIILAFPGAAVVAAGPAARAEKVLRYASNVVYIPWRLGVHRYYNDLVRPWVAAAARWGRS